MFIAESLNDFGHALGSLCIWASNRCEFVDCFAVDGFNHFQKLGVCGVGWVFGRWGEEILVSDGGDEGDDLDIMGEF